MHARQDRKVPQAKVALMAYLVSLVALANQDCLATIHQYHWMPLANACGAHLDHPVLPAHLDQADQLA